MLGARIALPIITNNRNRFQSKNSILFTHAPIQNVFSPLSSEELCTLDGAYLTKRRRNKLLKEHTPTELGKQDQSDWPRQICNEACQLLHIYQCDVKVAWDTKYQLSGIGERTMNGNFVVMMIPKMRNRSL